MSPNNKNHSIVFINPPGPSKLYRSVVCTYISKANYIWQPKDFILLSAHIPQDYDLKFFDCSISGMREEHLLDKLKCCPPGMAVIALSSVIFEKDLNFLKNFKSNFPNVKCLVLGDILLEDVFWSKVLTYADGLILNPMDIDLENYIKTGRSNSPNLIFKNSNVQRRNKNAKPKKVSVGIPQHKPFINKKYRFPFVKAYLYSTVSSQFSCPYRCKYCGVSKIPVTYRDYREVLAEIEHVRILGVKDIFFGDSCFGFPSENTRQLVEGMIREHLSMRWVCYTNPISLDKEFLKLMKEAGCHTVIIGIEDEDTEMLKKKYHRISSKSMLKEFCKTCRNLNIQVCGDFIIGLNRSESAIDRMVHFAKELRLDYTSFNILTAALGSILREELVKEGKFDPYTIDVETSGTLGKTDEEIVRLRNLAIKKFYLRPEYLIRRIVKIRSFSELIIKLEEMVVLFKNTVRSKRRKGIPLQGKRSILNTGERADFNVISLQEQEKLEEGSFWFRGKRDLILWVITHYFHHKGVTLEIGSGTGFILSDIKKSIPFMKILASDVYIEGLRHVKKRLPDVSLYQFDACNIPFKNKLDIIVACDVIEHIQQDEKVLHQMFQAIRDSGGLVLTVPQHPFLYSSLDEFLKHKRRYTKKEFVRKVEEAGFSVDRVASFGSLVFPLKLVDVFIRYLKKMLNIKDERLHIVHLPKFLNDFLYIFMKMENSLIKKNLSFPFGGTLLIVAKKVNSPIK